MASFCGRSVMHTTASGGSHKRSTSRVLRQRGDVHEKPCRLEGLSIRQAHEEETVLLAGDIVSVWSHTAGRWLNAEVDEILSCRTVHVTYQFEGEMLGKQLSITSQELQIPNTRGDKDDNGSEELIAECDPGFVFFPDDEHKERRIQHLSNMARNGHQMSNNEVWAALKGNQEELDKLNLPPILSRPDFLPHAGDVSQDMKNRQREDPTKWAMTLAQWNQFIEACKQTPLWTEIKASKGKDGYVSLFDMSEHFVVPWTQGTSCSIAVLMGKGMEEATVMLSHSWAEDMEECQKAVNAHFTSNGIAESTPVWFCGFSLYQAQDDPSITIQKQLELNPFTRVIESEPVKSRGRMIAVHTTRADLYERLWCVREVDESLEKGVKTVAALSQEYEDKVKSQYTMVIDAGGTDKEAMEMAGSTVHAAKAKCSNENDQKMLLDQLLRERKRTFERINEAVTSFRRKEVLSILNEALLASAKRGNPGALVDLAKEGDLHAVKMLFELAEKGDMKAHDAFFLELQTLAKSKQLKDRRWHENFKAPLSASCYEEPTPEQREVLKNQALGLVVALLQKMAGIGHEQSFDLLKDLDCASPSGKLDDEAMCRQQCYRSLQAMAKQGCQQAVDELIKKAVDGEVEKYCTYGYYVPSKAALESLVQHWNIGVLLALQDMAKDDKLQSIKSWARQVLQQSSNSLLVGWKERRN